MNRVDKLRKEYETQDNRGTAYPIHVSAQELVCIGVMADGYSACCPYGDGETKTKYKLDGFGDPVENREDLIKDIKEYYDRDFHSTREAISEIEEIRLGYIWVDREVFLTIKGAEAYLKANAHNMGKTRTYVNWFHYRNVEMRELLAELKFKIG